MMLAGADHDRWSVLGEALGLTTAIPLQHVGFKHLLIGKLAHTGERLVSTAFRDLQMRLEFTKR